MRRPRLVGRVSVSAGYCGAISVADHMRGSYLGRALEFAAENGEPMMIAVIVPFD